MGVTWSNSGLFSTPHFIFSPVGKKESVGHGEKLKGRREKGDRKGKVGRKKE